MKRRLAADREERAAAAAQVRLDDLVDQLLGVIGARLLELRRSRRPRGTPRGCGGRLVRSPPRTSRPSAICSGIEASSTIGDDQDVLRRYVLAIAWSTATIVRVAAAAEALDRAQRDVAVRASSRRALIPSCLLERLDAPSARRRARSARSCRPRSCAGPPARTGTCRRSSRPRSRTPASRRARRRSPHRLARQPAVLLLREPQRRQHRRARPLRDSARGSPAPRRRSVGLTGRCPP